MSEHVINGETIMVDERPTSRRESTGKERSLTLEYLAYGSEYASSIKRAVQEEAPGTCEGLYRGAMEIEPTDRIDLWYVTVKYGAKASTESSVTASDFRFDTGRETVRLNQAIVPTPAEKRFARPGETAPDDKGVIGWDGERAQGVEIGAGAFRFSVTRRFTDGEVDKDYIRLLSRKSYRMNDDDWWLWDKGEVLFEGASGGRTGGGAIAVIGDDEGQLGILENMTGITADNTDAGQLYVTISGISGLGNCRIRFYKDADLTETVAEVALASVGENTVTPMNGSGIGGKVDLLAYTMDTDSIVVAFPFPWEITLNFAVSENLSDETLGDIVDIRKLGWEYLDVQFADETETAGGVTRITARPKTCYARTVYRTMDFDDLKAGECPFG